MIIIKKIKPMFTGIVTTCDMMTEEDTKVKGTSLDLVDTSKMKMQIKELQTVVAVGDHAAGIKIGDVVCINPKRFEKMLHTKGSLKDGVVKDNPIVTYEFDFIELDGEPHLMLDTRDIKYIVEEYEEFDENPTIVTPEKKIIL